MAFHERRDALSFWATEAFVEPALSGFANPCTALPWQTSGQSLWAMREASCKAVIASGLTVGSSAPCRIRKAALVFGSRLRSGRSSGRGTSGLEGPQGSAHSGKGSVPLDATHARHHPQDVTGIELEGRPSLTGNGRAFLSSMYSLWSDADEASLGSRWTATVHPEAFRVARRADTTVGESVPPWGITRPDLTCISAYGPTLHWPPLRVRTEHHVPWALSSLE